MIFSSVDNFSSRELAQPTFCACFGPNDKGYQKSVLYFRSFNKFKAKTEIGATYVILRTGLTAGHFRYFLTFSIIRNDFFHFLSS